MYAAEIQAYRSPYQATDAEAVKTIQSHMATSTKAETIFKRSKNMEKNCYSIDSSFLSSPIPNAASKESSVSNFGILLELVLPVAVKIQEVDEGSKNLGISLRLTRGANGVSRQIVLCLTDPADPFFLYQMELSEEEYGTFKQELELVVDFHGFPCFLVEMLQHIVDGSLPYRLTFSADASECGRGELRIVEVTSFRTIEHLSLCLIRQGDRGQKKYLAERFQHFETAYKKCSAESKEEIDKLSSALGAVRKERDELQRRCSSLQEERRLAESQNEKDLCHSLTELRSRHKEEIKELSDAHAGALKELQEAYRSTQEQLLADLRCKDSTLSVLQEKYQALESKHCGLTKEHESLSLKVASLADTQKLLEESKAKVEKSLQNYMEEAQKNDLTIATLTEKLNGANRAVDSKTEELECFKQQHEQQNSCMDVLSTQNEKLTEQVKELEKNITKAHYIISKQLQTASTVKNRYKLAMDQLRVQGSLLEERESTLLRRKEEIGLMEEKLHGLEERNSVLQENLAKTSSMNEELSKELQQLRDALVQVQKSTSLTGQYFGRRPIFSPYSAKFASSSPQSIDPNSSCSPLTAANTTASHSESRASLPLRSFSASQSPAPLQDNAASAHDPLRPLSGGEQVPCIPENASPNLGYKTFLSLPVPESAYFSSE